MPDTAVCVLREGAITREDLAALATTARRTKVSLWSLVDAQPGLTDDAVAEAFERMLGLARVRMATVSVESDALNSITEKLARKHLCLPLTVRDRTLVVAMADPSDYTAIQDLEFASGYALKPVLATRQEIVEGLDQHYAPEDRVRQFVEHVAPADDFQILRYPSDEADGANEPTVGNAAEATPVVKLCNLMVYDGIKQSASDIHVEPGLNDVAIRMRIDGALRTYTHFPKWLHAPVVSRLKILARLDIADRRRPQDGRLKVVYRGTPIDVRVSTLPTHFGEKVVMRVLGSGRIPSLRELGFNASQRSIIERALGQTQGTILVTGPTGSGKTTTLYSMLEHARSGELNVVTIEDPIEYQLEGVTQVQVNIKAGLTFAGSLRSILRQDPDVILLGEIRDLETADIAFQATMTGHLVLSTLHTNSAVATITRLFDLGVDPVSIASSLSVLVAQRLVRRVCPDCVTAHGPTAAQLEELGLPATGGAFKRGAGCPACDNTGFRGRVGLFEVMPVTASLKALITRRATEPELRRAAAQQGVRTLLECGADAVAAGLTTAEEVLRITQREDQVPDELGTITRTCIACGQPLQPGWKVCPHCSAVVEPSPPPSAAPLAPGPASSARAPAKQPRILVADDDAVIRRMVQAALSQLDDITPIVEFAVDGEEALAAVAREAPDLIVLDLMMPHVTGLEVCARLREDLRTAFVPVLMLTMNNDEATRTKGFLAGTDDFMAKPFSVPELVARVRRLLRRTYGVG